MTVAERVQLFLVAVGVSFLAWVVLAWVVRIVERWLIRRTVGDRARQREALRAARDAILAAIIRHYDGDWWCSACHANLANGPHKPDCYGMAAVAQIEAGVSSIAGDS